MAELKTDWPSKKAAEGSLREPGSLAMPEGRQSGHEAMNHKSSFHLASGCYRVRSWVPQQVHPGGRYLKKALPLIPEHPSHPAVASGDLSQPLGSMSWVTGGPQCSEFILYPILLLGISFCPPTPFPAALPQYPTTPHILNLTLPRPSSPEPVRPHCSCLPENLPPT